jgi:hypothetical protein
LIPEIGVVASGPPIASPPLCLLNVFAASPNTFRLSIPLCAALNAATCRCHALFAIFDFIALCLKERKYILNPFKKWAASFYNTPPYSYFITHSI